MLKVWGMLPLAATYEQVREDFRWEIPSRFNIGVACCDEWARREPGRVALRRFIPGGEPQDTTYGELLDLSNRLANHLTRSGLAPGDRCGIILPQSVETVVSHLAIYKAGLIAVPLARLFAADAIRYRLARAGVKVVVTTAEGFEKIQSVRHELPDLREIIVVDAHAARCNRFCRGACAGRC